MLLISTIIKCESTIEIDKTGSFFSVPSYGVTYALGITATAQPLVGYVSDHIGVSFSFIFWLLMMVTISCLTPILVM